MQQHQQAWGAISASFISAGVGTGEVCVKHDGTLFGHQSDLDDILLAFRGVQQLSLSREFWVVKGSWAPEILARDLVQAIHAKAAEVTTRAPEPARRSRRKSVAAATGS